MIILLSCVLTVAAQTPQTQEEKLAAAKAAFAEGFESFKKGTAESLRSAIQRFETANKLFQQAGEKKWQAATLLARGRVANDLGDKPTAIERYKEALPLLRAAGEKLGEVAALNNIGAAFFALGEAQLALKYFERALPLIRVAGDKSQEATTLNNLGGIYNMFGDNHSALKYY